MEKHFGLRINSDLLSKFRYVSAFYGRSANSQIIQLIQKCVAEYEAEYEKIGPEELAQFKNKKPAE